MPAAPQARPDAEIAGLCARLVDIARRLTDLLARETTLVRAMRINEIAPLQREKTELTAQYQTAFKAMVSLHDGKSLPAAMKEQLAVSGQRLAAAVMDNELALRVGKVATERLIGSIVAAVKEKTKFGVSYAPQRAVPRYTFMTAAAVDRRL